MRKRTVDRKKRVLRDGTLQILWALLLVHLILLGVGFLFGREVGYEISFGVCLGIALFITLTFLILHVLDRLTAAGAEKLRSFRAVKRRRVP